MEGVDYALAPIVLAALTQVPGLIQGVSAANAAKIRPAEMKQEPEETKTPLLERFQPEGRQVGVCAS